MEDSLEDRRKRSRRRRRRWPQLVFLLVLGSYRLWYLAASASANLHSLAPRSRNARHLGELPASSDDNAADDSESRLHCGSISTIPHHRRCDFARRHCKNSRGVVNFVSLHYCALDDQPWLSLPLLAAAICLAFFSLAETAERFFSPVATLMVEMLRMSPTMGGVTLLALGNGAPDVFASMAAIGGGNARIGLGAVVSAGTFVSAFVVGSVALVAAPFAVKPLAFVRDVVFYLAAVGVVFVVYMKGVVTFWQAVGFVSLYALFIVVVLVMDHVREAREAAAEAAALAAGGDDGKLFFEEESYVEANAGVESEKSSIPTWWKPGFMEQAGVLKAASRISFKIRSMLQAPLHIILRATIPEINPSNWSRIYATANFIFCPLLLLVMLRSMIPIAYPVALFAAAFTLPLWSLVLIQNLFIAAVFFVSSAKHPPEPTTPTPTTFPAAFAAFVMSVFWISFIAGELLGCLAALGIVLGISPSLLGLTILAWGNSMGDLVADVAIARAGKPRDGDRGLLRRADVQHARRTRVCSHAPHLVPGSAGVLSLVPSQYAHRLRVLVRWSGRIAARRRLLRVQSY